MTESALALHDVYKRFAGVVALKGASLDVRAGTVHAVLGENGAGKTTLMRIAYGMTRADAGSVAVRGRTARIRSPADAIAYGVGMVHQHFMLVPAMTVAENVALGLHAPLRIDRVRARVRELGERVGLSLDPDARVSDLGVGAQQRLEIVKALMRDASVLILDEPSAVLAPGEAAELMRWIRRFAAGDRAVVLITHRLSEALSVANDITVLRRGAVVYRGSAASSSADQLVHAMLGEGVEQPASRPRAPLPGKAVLRARDVDVVSRDGARRIRNASFEIHGGEIVGVAAVEGTGHRELLRALAGRSPVSTGELLRPHEVGFVPEDRHRDALILTFDLIDNVALRGAGERHGLMPWKTLRLETEHMLRRFDIQASGANALALTLSGGNQQRLVFAREVANDPPALILENPTRGLDVRATHLVHQHIFDARDAGVAVVVHTGDLDELLYLADRILVVHGGMVREVAPDRDVVGRAMLGAP